MNLTLCLGHINTAGAPWGLSEMIQTFQHLRRYVFGLSLGTGVTPVLSALKLLHYTGENKDET